LLLLIPFILLCFGSRRQRAGGIDWWLIFMIVILLVDVLSGSLLFALVQGGLLVWYLSQRSAVAGLPELPTRPPGLAPASTAGGPGTSMR